jgi:hypothetical protein
MSDYDTMSSIPMVPSAARAAATVMGQKLWYFYVPATSSASLMRTTFTISGYVDAEAFSNNDAWATPAAVEIPELRGYTDALASGATPATTPIGNPLSVAVATMGATIYLLWSDGAGKIRGTRSAGDDLWEPEFTLDTGPYPVVTDCDNAVTAYVLNGNLIVAWLSTKGSDRCAAVASYLPDDIRPAASGTGLAWPPITEAVDRGGWSGANKGTGISARCTIVPSLDGGDSKAYVFVVIEATKTTATTETWTWVHCCTCDTRTGLPTTVLRNESINIDHVSLDLDASNTVYAYGLDKSSALVRVPLMNAAGEPVFDDAHPTSQVAAGSSMHTSRPVIVSYVAASQRAGSLKSAPDADASTLDTVETPLYRFLFCSPAALSDPPQVSIRFYGSTHLIATINDLYVNDRQNPNARSQAMAAKGIIDGPLPVPGQNLRMMSQGGTVAPWDVFKPIGRVTYGTNVEDDTTHQVTVTGTVGGNISVEASAGVDWSSDVSAGVTFGAMGIFDVSWSASTTGGKLIEMLGTSLAYSHQNTTERILRKGVFQAREANVVGLTRVVPNSDYFQNPSEDAPPVLSDQGFVWGAALSVVNLALAFEDPARPGVLPPRPSTITFLPTSKVQLAASYTANFAFTPGNLDSYKPEAINKKMADAYANWRKEHAGAPDPFGDDYNDYVEKVLNKRALPIGVGGRRYLEFSVANNGMLQAHYELGSYVFEEWGSEVSNEFYSAATWENLANLVGYEVKSYLEAGGSFNFSTGYNKSSERSSRWGISAEMTNFPEATHAGDVSAYTFRLYLLPADNRWVQELLCFSDYSQRGRQRNQDLGPEVAPLENHVRGAARVDRDLRADLRGHSFNPANNALSAWRTAGADNRCARHRAPP